MRSRSPAVKAEQCDADGELIVESPLCQQRNSNARNSTARADSPSLQKRAPRMSAVRRRVISSSLAFGTLALLIPTLCIIEVYFTWLRPCAHHLLDAGICIHYRTLIPIAPYFILAITAAVFALAMSALHFAARCSSLYNAATFPQPLVICALASHVISATCMLLLTDACIRVGYISPSFAVSVMAIEALHLLYFVLLFFMGLSG